MLPKKQRCVLQRAQTPNFKRCDEEKECVVLTPDDQLDWGGCKGVLRGEVRSGHLAFPLAVVELDGRASNPDAAVAPEWGHWAHHAPRAARHPLVLSRIHSDGLEQKIESF